MCTRRGIMFSWRFKLTRSQIKLFWFFHIYLSYPNIMYRNMLIFFGILMSPILNIWHIHTYPIKQTPIPTHKTKIWSRFLWLNIILKCDTKTCYITTYKKWRYMGKVWTTGENEIKGLKINMFLIRSKWTHKSENIVNRFVLWTWHEFWFIRGNNTEMKNIF